MALLMMVVRMTMTQTAHVDDDADNAAADDNDDEFVMVIR